jgi:hypothetical protein
MKRRSRGRTPKTDRKQPTGISADPSAVSVLEADKPRELPDASASGSIVAKDLLSIPLDGAAKQLFDRIQAYRRDAHLSIPPPAILYHYTSSRGLLGIVEGNALWATHIGYLNDASELLYASSMVREALFRRRDSATSQVARDFCDFALTSFNLAEALGIYVACFCEEGDLLSQWRGYAGAGEGYSIGVRAGELAELGGFGFKFFFGRVEYSRDRQQEIIDTIIGMTLNGLLGMIRGMSNSEASAGIRKCCKVFQQSIWYALVTFKDALFSSENEWRAIRLVEPEQETSVVKLRPAGGQLIPYVELEFSGSPWRRGGKLPLACVYHGPTLSPDLAKRSLELLLSKSGYPKADIRGSKIPLRVVGG